MEDGMSLHKEISKFKEQWDLYWEGIEKPGQCIFCEGNRLYWNGYRERSASVMIEGEVVYLTDILCKRVKCAQLGCGKSWTLRPPGIMPRRHYQLCVLAHGITRFFASPHETLTSVAEDHCCSRRTVDRWLHWIAGVVEPSDLLRRLYLVSRERALKTIFKVRGILREVPDKIIYQKTVNNFCLLESLGNPSGLGFMIEKAVADRDRITTYRYPFIPELAR